MSSVLLAMLLTVSIEPSEVEAALRAHVDSTRWHKKFLVAVTSTWERPELGAFRQVVRIRKDGDRVDYAGETRRLEHPEFAGNVTFRAINDGTWFLNRTTTIGRKKLTGGRTARRDSMSRRNLEASANGFNLDGYFPGNEERTLTEILAEAPDLEATRETIDGQMCLAMSARTRYGAIRVCLDPNSGFALRFARLQKVTGDWNGDGSFGETPETQGMTSWSIELRNVSVEKIGEFHIPTRATIEVESRGNAANRTFSYELSRSEFDLDPDFTGTDAFKMDFDEGARVTDFDQAESKIGYIWVRGEMLPEGGQGIPSTGTGGFHNASSARQRVWWILAGNAVVLIVGVVWYLWSRIRHK